MLVSPPQICMCVGRGVKDEWPFAKPRQLQQRSTVVCCTNNASPGITSDGKQIWKLPLDFLWWGEECGYLLHVISKPKHIRGYSTHVGLNLSAHSFWAFSSFCLSSGQIILFRLVLILQSENLHDEILHYSWNPIRNAPLVKNDPIYGTMLFMYAAQDHFAGHYRPQSRLILHNTYRELLY